MSRKPRVRPWTWSKGQPDERRGALIYNSDRCLFIPEALMTTISDGLIDILENYEQEQK